MSPRTSAGDTSMCGYDRKLASPSEIIRPHDGIGGLTPMPRKERLASSMIAPGTPKAAATMTGARTFGKMCAFDDVRAGRADRARRLDVLPLLDGEHLRRAPGGRRSAIGSGRAR